MSGAQLGGERVVADSKTKSLADAGQDTTAFFPAMLTLSFGSAGGGLEPGLSKIWSKSACVY